MLNVLENTGTAHNKNVLVPDSLFSLFSVAKLSFTTHSHSHTLHNNMIFGRFAGVDGVSLLSRL